MRKSEAITPSDKRVVQTLLSALQPFSNLRQHHAALRTVTTFLTVANNEGRALSDYARDLKIHRAYMSAIIHDLADHARPGGPGLGLVEIREEKRGKRLEILLTDKGRALAKAMRSQQILPVLQPFSNMPRPVALRTVTAFLMIAANEGKSPAEIAAYLKVDRSSMRKIINDLANRARNGGPGLGLIQIDDASLPGKRQALFLTTQGCALAQQMCKALRNQQTPGHSPNKQESQALFFSYERRSFN